MKSNKNVEETKNKFKALFSETGDNTIKHDALILMSNYLSEIERFQEQRGIKRTKLAELINTSASYLTQVFRGNKPLNFETIAKIRRVLRIKFKVTAYSEEEYVYHSATNAPMVNIFLSHSVFNKELVKETKHGLVKKGVQSNALVQVIQKSHPSNS